MKLDLVTNLTVEASAAIVTEGLQTASFHFQAVINAPTATWIRLLFDTRHVMAS